MSRQDFKNYALYGVTINQPNIIEKLIGTIRRSPKLYVLLKFHYEVQREDDSKGIFYIEVKTNKKNIERLIKLYEMYVEVLEVGNKEIDFNENL